MIKKPLLVCLYLLLFTPYAHCKESPFPHQKREVNHSLSDEIDRATLKKWCRIYLASYPRAGNHWCRYLIEESCHIVTGSVCIDKDPLHMKKPFPWGGYAPKNGYEGHCRYPNINECVLIKTHFPSQPKKISQFDELPYKVTIRLNRHPVDSFYSRYIRQPRGPIQDIVPTDRVKEFIEDWRRFQLYWNKKKNVITFRYEDLLENPAEELRKILTAIEYPFTDEDIERAVSKHPPEGHMLKHIDKFSKQDLKMIARELGDLLEQLGYDPSQL